MSYPTSTLTDRMRYVLMGRSADTHGVISEAITEIESLRAQLADATKNLIATTGVLQDTRLQLAAAEAERDEQCNLLAAGMERELNFQLRAERAEAERERAVEEIDHIARTLPGLLYMDPPDGGDVSLAEQFARMAKDAARYTVVREAFTHAKTSASERVLEGLGLIGDPIAPLDGIIDAAIASTAGEAASS